MAEPRRRLSTQELLALAAGTRRKVREAAAELALITAELRRRLDEPHEEGEQG